jgi:hypothetical protein
MTLKLICLRKKTYIVLLRHFHLFLGGLFIIFFFGLFLDAIFCVPLESCDRSFSGPSSQLGRHRRLAMGQNRCSERSHR